MKISSLRITSRLLVIGTYTLLMGLNLYIGSFWLNRSADLSHKKAELQSIKKEINNNWTLKQSTEGDLQDIDKKFSESKRKLVAL